MGNPVSLSPHNSISIFSAIPLSSQVSPYLDQRLLVKPCCSFHRTSGHKIRSDLLSLSPAKVLRPDTCSAADVCTKLFIYRTAQAPSGIPVIRSNGFSYRGRFMMKSHNGNAKNEDDAREAAFQASVKQSRKLLDLQDRHHEKLMKIIVVGTECAPWSKTGGLADVVGALPKALARRGHRVMVIAPRYSDYIEAWDTRVHKCYKVAGKDMEVGYFHADIDGIDYIFIDNPIFHAFKDNIYGGSQQDILTRMILLCKASIEVPWHVPCGGVCYGDGNLVFVANDWHTALLPVYLKAYYHEYGLMKYTRCILVIHNILHQGRGQLDDFRLLTLPDHYLEKFMLEDPIGGTHLNIFMAGLKTAHRLVAVSHTYAWECQTQEGGWGLHDVLKENRWKLRGIVNGIDSEWNPEFDVHLISDGYVNYSLNTLETGKATCKSALQRELGLPVCSDVPLISFIGRLDQQKGIDVIAEAMPWMMEQDLQLVMLGAGREDLETMLHSFEVQYRDKFRGWVGFSVRTAHHIIAGADILLMPSRFEPCGLNQLYAMQYGTIPVVHAVGGLKDTVKPYDPLANSGTGWTFEPAESAALIDALGNALRTYHDFKQSWLSLQKCCMSQDLSWDNAAQQYEEVLLSAKYQW